MAYRSATVPFSFSDAAVQTSPRNTAIFDFSMPIVRADSWLASSEDVIEASVAGLIAKERRFQLLMNQTLAACETSGKAVPSALGESASLVATHGSALKALYPSYVYPLVRGTDRIRMAIVSACCALVAKLVSYKSSYPAKLYELYAAASEISIGYVALQATALSLGDRCAAAVAARHIRHVGQLLLTLHEIIPCESVRELQQRGLNASTDDLWEVAGISATG